MMNNTKKGLVQIFTGGNEQTSYKKRLVYRADLGGGGEMDQFA